MRIEEEFIPYPARRPAVEIRADPVDDRLGRVGTPAPAP